MTDASGGKEPSPYRRPRWTDRGRELARAAGPGLLAAVRTGWGRLVPLLRSLQEAADVDLPSPPPPEEVLEHREMSGLIRVAAKGHAYLFTVRALFTWSATGVRPEALIWCAHHFTPAVHQRLWRTATDQARAFEAHRAGDLEVALRAALDEEGAWRYAHRGVQVECRPEVWIRHDDRVRAALQAHWDRLMELKRQYELYLARARYAEDLNRRWVAILDEMVEDRAGSEEAEAITDELARARRHMVAEQRAAAQWSEELLRDRESFQGMFEPFTAIDIIPQQSTGPDRDASGGAAETSRTAEATSPDDHAVPKATSAEHAVPKATSAEHAARKATSAEGTARNATSAEGASQEAGQDERR